MRVEEVIRCVKKKEMEALVNWFDEKHSDFYKIGWAYLRRHHDIEDVFQTTILKVYDHINQLREPQYFETWVTSIFINECKRLYRKRKKEFDQDVEPIGASHQDHTKMELLDRLEQLEEPYKEVIILKYINDFSQEDIADLLEIPLGTVKSRVYRGLKRLRKQLQKGEVV
ncbi:RNA polymerase sigma factor SigV [Halalkalibacter krulwichiae]|uniref:RNA polymerase sigma factor SigV n=1 Tax=Halalkalibacter krulwichiae TaxID=199441 RepID=A0A1X9MGQ4_9BACI|nr:sigma-70 family RNA polymerase sigma factor [Halalkalibacter krulwichiae]ARK32645.1 RNA polymerase sigma factor SigV [Halalkalibacter krulwichiae]